MAGKFSQRYKRLMSNEVANREVRMEQSVKEASPENCDCGLNTGQAVENVLRQNMACPRGDTYRTRILLAL